MHPELPPFRYHPDPLATGAVKPSPIRCVCCGQQRGFVYVGPVYGEAELHESFVHGALPTVPPPAGSGLPLPMIIRCVRLAYLSSLFKR
jgi:hypothetical protein